MALAKLRDPHIKASEETIRKSLVGNWRREHLFTLQQSRKSYQHYQEQIRSCDEEIEKFLMAFVPRGGPGRTAAALGPKAQAAGTQKEEREPDDRLRSAD